MYRSSLPKKHVLRTNGEFQRVYRGGRRCRGDGFAVLVLANALPWNRLGISVHRKVGNAVRRNRIKRLIREIFRCNRDQFSAQSDIVVTIRPNFTFDNLEVLRTALLQVTGDSSPGGRDAFT